MNQSLVQCVVVMGPTATGKTRLGVALARQFHGEIIGADSRQVYRGLDIGTGKDLKEFGTGPERVPYHLIDIADPTEDYHLFRFVADARQAIGDVLERGHLPIVVGGSALYLNALLDDYSLEGGEPDPELRRSLECLSEEALLEILRREAPDIYARTDQTQKRRIVRAVEIARSRVPGSGNDAPPALDALLIAPYYKRQVVHERIAARLDERLKEGLLDEVQALHDRGLSWERLDYFGLEYRYVAQCLQGTLTLAEMREKLFFRIRRFCKSQDIWFRKMERAGKIIHWLPGGDLRKAIELVRLFLDGKPLPPPEIALKDTFYGPQSTPQAKAR